MNLLATLSQVLKSRSHDLQLAALMPRLPMLMLRIQCLTVVAPKVVAPFLLRGSRGPTRETEGIGKTSQEAGAPSKPAPHTSLIDLKPFSSGSRLPLWSFKFISLDSCDRCSRSTPLQTPPRILVPYSGASLDYTQVQTAPL